MTWPLRVVAHSPAGGRAGLGTPASVCWAGQLQWLRSMELSDGWKQTGRTGIRAGGLRRLLPMLAPLLVTVGSLLALAPVPVHAESCTTQAKMTSEMRSGLSDAALGLAQSIQAGDAAKVQAATIAEFASATAFAPTAALVQTTSARVSGDALQVTQIYELDASSRSSSDTSDADFSCPLTGTTSETDFAISGLPRGLYGFAMVEATGARPWLLAFLLRQDAGVWKLAGFYPRAREAAGHDGLWYWKSARVYAKADELWLAWIFYGEADELLRPANFATSTNLDRLRSEQRAAAPPELVGGIGPNSPLVVAASASAAAGAPYRFTSIGAEGSEENKQLNLILHLRSDDLADAAAAGARSKAAARAFLDAHIELRQAFQNVWVFADSAGHEPLVTEQTISDIP